MASTLISLFGAVPEAFKAKPSVFTQCPEAGTAPGTCTMHAQRLDLGPALVALGYLKPPIANVFVPSPNHSHVVNERCSQRSGNLVASASGAGSQSERLAEQGRNQRSDFRRGDRIGNQSRNSRGSAFELLPVLQFPHTTIRNNGPQPHAITSKCEGSEHKAGLAALPVAGPVFL